MKSPMEKISCRVFLFVFAAGIPLPTSAQTGGACPAIVATRPSVAPPQRFRAGDVAPAFALDTPLQWMDCPAPEFPAGASADAKRRVFLFVTVDENGVVTDVKPRGSIDPEGYFDAAVGAVRRWKSSAPKWRSLAVRCAFAADIVFDRTQPAGAAPAAAPAETAQVIPQPVAEKTAPPPVTALATVPTTEKPPSSAASEAVSAIRPAPVESPASTPPPSTAAVERPSTPQTAAPGSAREQKPAAQAQTPDLAPSPSAATPPIVPPAADPKPAATASVESPATFPAAAKPPSPDASEPADSCPQFFVLPAGPNPQAYRAGDMVPNSALDARPAWVRCPWPDFAGLAPRMATVIAVIDETGAVREVRPRGHRENDPVFVRAKAAVYGWRAAPAPRHRGQPVMTATSIDIRAEGPPRQTARATSTPPAPTTTAPSDLSVSAPPPTSTAARVSPSQRDERPQPAGAEASFAVEYYYKVKWGFADEFWQLFLKNHWPVLRKQMETGRILEVRASKPVYHATEDGRWDYRVTIVFRSASAAYAAVDTAGLERQLFPDQETFRREEQRRFELLLAHWDVPVAGVPLIR